MVTMKNNSFNSNNKKMSLKICLVENSISYVGTTLPCVPVTLHYWLSTHDFLWHGGGPIAPSFPSLRSASLYFITCSLFISISCCLLHISSFHPHSCSFFFLFSASPPASHLFLPLPQFPPTKLYALL